MWEQGDQKKPKPRMRPPDQIEPNPWTLHWPFRGRNPPKVHLLVRSYLTCLGVSLPFFVEEDGPSHAEKPEGVEEPLESAPIPAAQSNDSVRVEEETPVVAAPQSADVQHTPEVVDEKPKTPKVLSPRPTAAATQDVPPLALEEAKIATTTTTPTADPVASSKSPRSPRTPKTPKSVLSPRPAATATQEASKPPESASSQESVRDSEANPISPRSSSSSHRRRESRGSEQNSHVKKVRTTSSRSNSPRTTVPSSEGDGAASGAASNETTSATESPGTPEEETQPSTASESPEQGTAAANAEATSGTEQQAEKSKSR